MDRRPRTAAPLHALAFNSGSSSLKLGLYEVRSERAACLASGEAQRIGEERSVFRTVATSDRVAGLDTAPLRSPREVVERVGRWLIDTGTPAPQAVGHRVVHGGPALRRHCRIDGAVLRLLEAAQAFAPLHTPAVLTVVRAAQALFPDIPQVARFDTVFHAGMPTVASALPLPAALSAQGIQRYGFTACRARPSCTSWRAPLPAGCRGARRSPTWATAPASPPCETASRSTPAWA